MAKVYRPAKGAQFNKEDAQHLGQIMEEFGDRITPKDVVAKAKPKSSPIHHLFEWDDTAAAHRFRLFQARNHINRLEVVILVDNKERATKAYHSVVIQEDDERPERVYASMVEIQKSPNLAEQAIQNALDEANSWMTRYKDYKQVLGGVFTEIRKVSKRRKATQKKPRRKVAAVA